MSIYRLKVRIPPPPVYRTATYSPLWYHSQYDHRVSNGDVRWLVFPVYRLASENERPNSSLAVGYLLLGVQLYVLSTVESLFLFHLLFMSWFICTGRWFMEGLGVFRDRPNNYVPWTVLKFALDSFKDFFNIICSWNVLTYVFHYFKDFSWT